ncbi:MAG: ATP-binding protein [Bacilli bacterium]
MKQLLVLSGKGGTGKTTVTNALIELFQASGFADCDVDAPNLHLLQQDMKEQSRRAFFGMKVAMIDSEACISCGMCEQNCAYKAISHNPIYQVDPFGCEGCGLCERICPVQAIHMEDREVGLLQLQNNEKQVFSTATLHMGSGNSGLLVTEVKKQLINNVKKGIVLIDGAPGIGCPVIASLSGVDGCLMVAEPTISGFSDLKRVIQTARGFHPIIFVCVNKYDINEEITNEIENYCQQEKLNFVGKIPYDPEIMKQLNEGRGLLCASWPSKRAVIRIFIHIKEIMGLSDNEE